MPLIFGMFIGLIMGWVEDTFYPDGFSAIVKLIVPICICLFWGCSGIVLVARKEWPTMTWISLKGNPALITGIIWIIFWWGLAMMGLIRVIQKVLRS
jgi:hypothetical protein